ncbi:hypothetical protein GS397_10275 [Sphingobium yanoikuyae]|uniref:Uncharacterized protein n=1 Tax=Sphingobium yanoikuyae TaxID=13690 RepID=A0A6P1GG80_SPHYA|nr:hypothetical protein [Sphingobium yanoikuyae]QHD67398.1 hypothetical protein GS397_10275 [Sphingobium yanoikuyae]
MEFSYEQGGSISVTHGSKTVAGAGTSWATGYAGVLLNIAGLNYPVASIDGAMAMTLVDPYPGETATDLPYALIPVQPENYQLSRQVNNVLDLVQPLVDASTGPAGPPGPAGPVGPTGPEGVGHLEIVNLSEAAGQLAGQTGVYVMVPVVTNDPGVELTQQASVTIPFANSNARVALYATTSLTGLSLILGATNAPAPQPEVPTEPIDLSGSGTIYGAPGTIFPLGIYLGGSTAEFTISIPNDFPVKIERKAETSTPVASQWLTGASGSPYPVAGNAVSSSAVLDKKIYGDGTTDFQNGHLILNRHAYLQSQPLGLEFGQVADEATSETPPRIKIGIKAAITGDNYPILAALYQYGFGQIQLRPHWSGQNMVVTLGRGGSEEYIISDEDPRRHRGDGVMQLYEVEYIDNVGGVGGTVKFYLDGVQVGAAKPANVKPRISNTVPFEVNATASNTNDSVDGLEVEYVTIDFDRPGVASTYEAVVSGPIQASDLEALVVDASGYTAAVPERHVTYTANPASGPQTTDLTVVVGPMQIPAGRAYKAVLEDWSSGVGVAHPNELIMTKPAAQNCRFEDVTLFGSQPSWMEVLPQGAVPTIGGISYYCEGIRMGNYVQFQFGYDWDSATMPANPFGDPTNKDSYMVPHKWMIYDAMGTLLARIEQPNGQPLNTTATPAIWEGQYDGRGVAMITADNRWYPKGTVRSGVIWRSHDPVAYSQEFVWRNVPTYDLAVPFASQTGYSVNGFDLRVYEGSAGNDGQSNGFANYRWMPWESSTYNEMIQAGANSLNPWKVGADQISITPNAGVWLKYTPFNQAGRSPITGPGGTRDDRQAMAEPVARYARDVTVKRPHDNRDMKEIALDYLTGYASDPYHCFENGRLTPLFKGNARRNVTMRNHYYGGGEGSTPADQAYYVQGGRLYEWASGHNPLRVQVPFAGVSSSKPVFGTNMIDDAHGHQFPHWGSLLFQSPEFAMLGHKFSDQIRLYMNNILASPWGEAGNPAQRGPAWKFIHAALMWKTASRNSQRLYSRAEVLDWVVFDFETFYDNYYASTPGYLNPPTTLNGPNDAIYAATARFGPCLYDGTYGVWQHDFMAGYWMSALHVAEKLGFNDALRAASPKAEAVVNWLITAQQKRIVGRINEGMLVNALDNLDYTTPIWRPEQIEAAQGEASALPQSFGQIVTAQGDGKSPSWDSFRSMDGANVYGRDGQAMDQLLAGPSLLLDMGRTASDLVAAETAALAYRQSKIDSETAKGAQDAGRTWFQYNQTTNNPPFKPPL